jgi:phytoene dehydrogenase-like protein
LRNRAAVERLAVATVSERFPAFEARVREVRSITPLDLEQTWGLTECDLNHGQPILDLLFFMRPIPGRSDHRTPIDGLYLCGSGVSGVAGRNAARRVLQLGDRR